MTDDGSFVMVGHAEGNWSDAASAGGLDFVAVALDADGNEIWRWQVRPSCLNTFELLLRVKGVTLNV